MPETEMRTTYSSHVVWEDEVGGIFYMRGHVTPERRAIAAVNYYARRECGLVNLADDPSASLSSVTVRYEWVRPDPDDDERFLTLQADDGHPGTLPLTVVEA